MNQLIFCFIFKNTIFIGLIYKKIIVTKYSQQKDFFYDFYVLETTLNLTGLSETIFRRTEITINLILISQKKNFKNCFQTS